MPKWTSEQQDAIYKKGTNIIVSAGAGSGKTAVLSERVLEHVKSGISIDDLLVLTFTNAAAAEMKDRIRSKIRKVPELKEELDKVDLAYITIPGKYTTIVQNSVVKETRERFDGISHKDVTVAMSMVRDIEMPDDEVLIDIVPDKFILEDGKTVEDPVGSYCSSFTLMAQLILADKNYIKKITSICRKAGIDIDGIVPITLAERNLVLDSNELNDNVMILDIGAGNTEIGVFKGNSFIFNDTLPLGGDNITSDIAYVLNISKEEADKLKRQ